jgi:farnesol dehydrogenase
MTTLITGATGFLGGAVFRMFARSGQPLRALVRSTEDLPEAADYENVELFQGDLADPESIDEGVRGVKRIFHIAAAVKEWVDDWSVFEQINVLAWENLIKASLRNNVEKIIYTSSFMALGASDKMEAGDESLEHDPKHFHNPYEKTKLQGYRIAQKYIEKGAPIVCLCPGLIYGPGPLTAGNFAVNLIRDLAEGNLPGIPGGGKTRWCFSYIDDVAEGHLLAMDQGQIGRTYILGGENRTIVEFIDFVCKEAGLERPKRNIPLWFLTLGAAGMELAAKISGKAPRITKGRVGVMGHDWAYSSDRALAELGYKIRSFEEGLSATLQWMKEERLL